MFHIFHQWTPGIVVYTGGAMVVKYRCIKCGKSQYKGYTNINNKVRVTKLNESIYKEIEKLIKERKDTDESTRNSRSKN